MSVSARDFAIKAHGDQRYGDGPYANHLKDVVNVLCDFGYKDEWAQAGWLHDVLENTLVSRNDIRMTFGFRVTAMVEACTGVGASRKARNNSIYRKIELFRDAAIVKVADRIANVEAAAPISTRFTRYLGERRDFDHFVTRYVPFAMKARLDREIDLRRSVMHYSA